MPGTYDAESNTLYWTTGNPGPDFDGSVRPGNNLYTDCVLALDPDTGKLKWYFQFTPHDVFDYDANETPVLIDLPYQGKPRKLLVQANRNGFLYVLDRTDGTFLHAIPFVDKLNSAKESTPAAFLFPPTSNHRQQVQKSVLVMQARPTGIRLRITSRLSSFTFWRLKNVRTIF